MAPLPYLRLLERIALSLGTSSPLGQPKLSRELGDENLVGGERGYVEEAKDEREWRMGVHS